MFGINLAGAEFGGADGVYGTDYIYPSTRELDYYQDKGVTLVRLPFRWEQIQPTLGGELDQAELGRMTAFLDAAEKRGIDVIIDLHNYGRYDGAVIGSSAVPISAFADVWSKLATELKDHPAIAGFGLMNEPHDMGSNSVWPTAAQAATDAIRATGSNDTIVVAGDNWSGAAQWKDANANLSVDDPLNKILYEAHVYFDRSGTGNYGSYDAEGAYSTMGEDRVQPFLDWLEENGARGFVGEYAVPDDDARWLTVLDNFLDVLDEHNIPSTYWAGGPWWGDNELAIEPRNGADRPQMDVLERYIDGVADAGPAPAPGVATRGDDVLEGGGGADVLRAGSGNDVVNGSGGDDELRGDAGNDTLHGNDGDDLVGGGEDDDKLYGDAGTDILGGNAGNDRLNGGEGNDQLYGDAGDDVLGGAAGDDWVEGGSGNDQLWGDAGADTFAFQPSSGKDTIMDFNATDDRLILNGQSFTVADTAEGAALHLSGGGMIVLQNIEPASFDSDWIIH